MTRFTIIPVIASILYASPICDASGLRGGRSANTSTPRRLGCDVEIWTDFESLLPTDLTVISSSIDHGNWCMKGCGGSGSNDCGTDEWFHTGSISCPLSDIYLSNNGGCHGSVGTITMQPSTDYTSQTGLESIEYSFDNSGGPNAATTTYSLTFNGGYSGYGFGIPNPTSIQ